MFTSREFLRLFSDSILKRPYIRSTYTKRKGLIAKKENDDGVVNEDLRILMHKGCIVPQGVNKQTFAICSSFRSACLKQMNGVVEYMYSSPEN